VARTTPLVHEIDAWVAGFDPAAYPTEVRAFFWLREAVEEVASQARPAAEAHRRPPDTSDSGRVAYANGMAQKWFRTVTRRTWDDNNFMTYDYAVNPLRALFLWREAQAPSLPVWIRYLLEFYSLDLTAELGALRVPVLVIQPGFDDGGFYVDQRDYMRDFCLGSWQGAGERSARLEFARVPRSRLFLMYDAPDTFDELVRVFMRRLEH
jgi:pimeloyl-ACP methyl ester carboxylesterase